MQRILSVETSRSSNLGSEFVSKRLCCSFLLTVAFFAVVGGFFLGRFATEKTLQKLKSELNQVNNKLSILDNNLRNTFQGSYKNHNCTSFISRIKCDHLRIYWEGVLNSSSNLQTQEILDVLNTCFNYDAN